VSPRSRRVGGRTAGRRVAAAGLLALLAACGGGQASTTATRRATTTTSTVSTGRFEVALPAGWRNQTSNKTETARFSQNGTVLLLLESPPPGSPQPNVNDVNANINVILAASPVPDDQLGAYLTSVSQGGATDLSQPQPFTLDGQTGLYITYHTNVSGTPGESQDMVVNHGGDTYDIVLNTSKFAFPLQLPDLKLVLDSWRWTG
jgi:hypothetical protein